MVPEHPIFFLNNGIKFNPIAAYIILAILLLLSAFFSSTETAYTSFSVIRMKNLAKTKKTARLALKLRESYDRFITTILIGNNIVNIVGTSLATMFPHVFAGLGRTLFIALVVSLIGELLTLFLFGYTGTFFDWIFVVIFSLYIGYDWHRAQSFPKTLNNAIDSACDLYIDIINLFIRILQILGSRN